MKPIVYFSRNITPENSLKLFKLLKINLTGKTAVKVNSGEAGNLNFIPPEFYRPLVFDVTGTICECNSVFPGQRNTTEKHVQLMNRHGWTKYFKVDICDAYGEEAILDIPKGRLLHQNIVGAHLLEYDSLLVVSHFVGHECGGFAGALEQLSMGCASSVGKALIHSAGRSNDVKSFFQNMASQEDFTTSMAEAASSVVKYFKGKEAFINIAANISLNCDCDPNAEGPCMRNIGLFASLDPVAVDKACLDAVAASEEPGKQKFLDKVNEKMGFNTLDCACALGVGSVDYQLVCID